MAYYTLSAGTAASGTVVNSGDYLDVYGTETNTTLRFGSYVYVYAGGVLNGTTMNASVMIVYAGGVANDTTETGTSNIIVQPGGAANGVAVGYTSYLDVAPGGSITDLDLTGGGYATIGVIPDAANAAFSIDGATSR